jgi:CHAT domain-containing protein
MMVYLQKNLKFKHLRRGLMTNFLACLRYKSKRTGNNGNTNYGQPEFSRKTIDSYTFNLLYFIFFFKAIFVSLSYAELPIDIFVENLYINEKNNNFGYIFELFYDNPKYFRYTPQHLLTENENATLVLSTIEKIKEEMYQDEAWQKEMERIERLYNGHNAPSHIQATIRALQNNGVVPRYTGRGQKPLIEDYLNATGQSKEIFSSKFFEKLGSNYIKKRLFLKAVLNLEISLRLYNDFSPSYDKTEYNEKIFYMRKRIGRLRHSLGENSKALENYEKALDALAGKKHTNWEGYLYVDIGKALQGLGLYEQSIFFFQNALANEKVVGTTHRLMGLTYSLLGQHEKSIHHIGKSIEIHQNLNNSKEEKHDLHCLGDVYFRQKMFKKAVAYWKTAISIGSKGDDDNHRIILSKMAVACSLLKRHKEATEYIEKCISLKNRNYSDFSEGLILKNLGETLFNMGVKDKSRNYLVKSINILKNTDHQETLWQAQQLVARQEKDNHNLSGASHYYNQAIETIEDIKNEIQENEVKINFMADKFQVFDDYIIMLQKYYKKQANHGVAEKALEIFERKQSRIFLEKVGESALKNYENIPRSEIEKYSELKNTIADKEKEIFYRKDSPFKHSRSIRMEIDRLKKILLDKEEAIRLKYPKYFSLKYTMPTSLMELQQAVLKEEEALIVYNVMKEATVLWSVSKNRFSPHIVDISQKDLAQKIDQYRKTYMVSNHREFRGQPIYVRTKEISNSDLYNLLIPKSIRSDLSSVKTVYIVPTGSLYLLPFETLKDEANRYLIERHAIAYLSSASLLKIIREAQSRKRKLPKYPLLAFANPVYGDSLPEKNIVRGMRTTSYRAILGDHFPSLPETEKEVRAIQAILNAPEESRPLWLKTNASRSNVLALNKTQALNSYRYIVFACHGILPGEIDQVTEPALVLSNPDPKTQENGYLTMNDVLGLSLNADLVVLSACNTGRGQSVQGEGVMGLTRAFMYAGTPATAVTLWAVESMSAKTLNVGFFQNLKDGKGPAQALREIKLDMLRGKHGEEWKKPYYWAPLVLFGDGN